VRVFDAVSLLESPFPNYGADIGGYSSWKSRIKRAKTFWDVVDVDGPILDFGCGPGLEVAIGRREGYDVYGMDCCPDWKRYWERLEIPVFLVDEKTPVLPDMKFATIYAIRSTGVRPENIAKALNSMLIEGGRLIVSPKKHMDGLKEHMRSDIRCGHYGKSEGGYAYTAC